LDNLFDKFAEFLFDKIVRIETMAFGDKNVTRRKEKARQWPFWPVHFHKGKRTHMWPCYL